MQTSFIIEQIQGGKCGMKKTQPNENICGNH